MKRSAILTIVMFMTAFPLISQDSPLLEESVRKLAEKRVASGTFPSLVIGVIRGDRQEIIPFGDAVDQHHAPDADTVYEIGSVTKTFTALLLADAVHRGQVALDEPVQKLLPDYAIPKSDKRAITLLELATQSSGLPRLPENLNPKDSDNPYASYKDADLRQFLAGYHLPHPPGDHYEYSNLGFGLLGHALSVKAGTTYGELVRTRITTPLAMNDTMITLSGSMKKRFATGHDASGKAAPGWDLGVLEGAGAIRSTCHDMLVYVRAHMHPPAGPLAAALASVIEPRRTTDFDGRKIALAWQVETRHGRTIVWHNGMTGGYASFIGFTSDGTRGVVVLTNISRDVGEIAFAALVHEALPPADHAIKLGAAILDEYRGQYQAAPGFVLSVTVVENELHVQATGQADFQCRPAREMSFSTPPSRHNLRSSATAAAM